MLGEGALELSASAEKEKHNLGLAGSYDLNSSTPRLDMQFNSQFQFGTNLGRSEEELNEHAYLYEQSYVETSGKLDYIFSAASIKWHNGYTSKTDFVESEELNSTRSSNFSEVDNTWSVNTGPSLIINRNNSFLIEASVNLAYMDSIDEITSEFNSRVSFLKSITPISQLGINSSRVCSEYEVASENNTCRKQYNIFFSTNKRSFDFKMEAGLSDDGKTLTDIYSGTIDYEMNRSSGISLLSTRSVSTILNSDDLIFKVDDDTLSSLVSTKSIEYSYKLGGRGLSIRFIEQSLIYGSNSTDSELIYFDINQKVYPNLCLNCLMSLNYDYSNFNDERYKHISTIALTKINSRSLSTSINFSKTRIKSELDVWSIGVLVKYNGRKTRLGGK